MVIPELVSSPSMASQCLVLPTHRRDGHTRAGVITIDGLTVEDCIQQPIPHNFQSAVPRQLQTEEARMRYGVVAVGGALIKRLQLEALGESLGGEGKPGAAPGELQQRSTLLRGKPTHYLPEVADVGVGGLARGVLRDAREQRYIYFGFAAYALLELVPAQQGLWASE